MQIGIFLDKICLELKKIVNKFKIGK